MATEVGKGLKRLHQARLQEQEVYAELYSLYDACAEREEQGLPPEPIAHAALAQKIQEAFLLAVDSMRSVDHALQHIAPLIARRTPGAVPATHGASAALDYHPPAAPHTAAAAAAATAPAVASGAAAAPSAMNTGSTTMTDAPAPPPGAPASASGAWYVAPDGTLAQPESETLPSFASLLSTSALRRGSLWEFDLSDPAPGGRGAVFPAGLDVAALTDADSSLWILGRITALRPRVAQRAQVYEVLDADQEMEAALAAAGARRGGAGGVKKKIALTADRLVPLPSLREFPAHARVEFPAGKKVLALYPVDNVSSFYRCTVVRSAKKRGDAVYEVLFEDDGDAPRLVSAKYVVPLPPGFGT